MNNRVTSVELSKKLQILGISIKPTHWWRISSIGVDKVVHYELRTDIQKMCSISEEPIPALMVDELLEILPKLIIITKVDGYIVCWFSGNEEKKIINKRLSNALAEMVIFLKGKNIL